MNEYYGANSSCSERGSGGWLSMDVHKETL